MSIPNWYELVLLGLAAFRTWKLAADDTILDRPRKWVLARVQRRYGNGAVVYMNEFLECPWCLGFWVATIWWVAFQVWPHGTTIVSTPFAIAAVVGLIGGLISD